MKNKSAINWYYEVNDFCLTLSELYHVPLIKVAGIMSALSPNNTFASNCKSLNNFLKHKGKVKQMRNHPRAAPHCHIQIPMAMQQIIFAVTLQTAQRSPCV